jgi:G3E family GTPase
VIEAIPINVLTGFLGSGKTTLLNHLLRSDAFSDCAVLINEFGDVGVDHHLIESVQGDVVLLQSGCICCTVRGDLVTAVRSLYEQREAGSVPAFSRMVIETTGLADPTPVLSTIMHDRVIKHHFRVGNVITTVDAVNAGEQLVHYPAALKQIAVADRIVITKTDLADAAHVQALQARLSQINPGAVVLQSAGEPPSAQHLLGEDVFDLDSKAAEVARWLEVAPLGLHRSLARPLTNNRHTNGIFSFVLDIDRKVDWTVFGVWLTLLLNTHGDRVLRVKGLLDVAGSDTPVVVHGVQHLIHPPSHLPSWPEGLRRSRLVFILRDLEPSAIERSFVVFQQALANRP